MKKKQPCDPITLATSEGHRIDLCPQCGCIHLHHGHGSLKFPTNQLYELRDLLNLATRRLDLAQSN